MCVCVSLTPRMMCGPREAGDSSSIDCRFCKVSEKCVRFFFT